MLHAQYLSKRAISPTVSILIRYTEDDFLKNIHIFRNFFYIAYKPFILDIINVCNRHGYNTPYTPWVSALQIKERNMK